MAYDVLSLSDLSDDELVTNVQLLLDRERHATGALIAALGEVDARRLYLRTGCSSLFMYCTQVLHLSECAAYRRIEAARAARKFPVILELLANGDITLTTIGLVGRHLTPDNCTEVLAATRHKTKRDVERLVAQLAPKPSVAATVRKLPAPTPPAIAPTMDDAPAVAAQTEALRLPTPSVVAPLAPERYKVQLTVSRETHDKLRRAQDLLRHAIPTGDLAAIFDRALTLLVADLEKRKAGTVIRPRPSRAVAPRARHVPAAVRRAVWQRDGARCAFVGSSGRCTETAFVEFHHVRPYADGGASTVSNIELRCRAHNAYEAERWFGNSGEWTLRENKPSDGVRRSVRPGPTEPAAR